MESQKVTLLDCLYFIVKWKKWILINILVVGAVSTAISLFLPKWYRAEAILAPPQKDMSLSGGLTQMLSGIPMGSFLGISGMTEETGLYLAILESRTVMESVARKYDLISIYKKRNIEETVRVLRKKVDLGLDDDGSIRVRVLDKNPQRAADMTNSMVFYLDSLNIHLNIQRAKNNRVFIETRLGGNREDMEKAEKALTVFQQKYNMIALEEQTEAAIMVASELQAEMLKAKFELGMVSGALGENHSEVLRLKEQVASIERELTNLRYGEDLSKKGMVIRKEKGGEVLIPLYQIPEIGQQYLTLYKEVQVQNKLYIFLVQEYEQAKIQEIKDTPTVQVIDRGVPPVRKAKPKRAIVVLSCEFVCTFFLIFIIFFKEYLAILKDSNPVQYQKYERVFSQFRKSSHSMS
ncbi:MAG: GNVR domain-containing protein [bacterium]